MTSAGRHGVRVACDEVGEVLADIESGNDFGSLLEKFRRDPVYAMAAVKQCWINIKYVIVPENIVGGGASAFAPYVRIARAAVEQDAAAVQFLSLQYEEVILEVLERNHNNINRVLPEVRASKDFMLKAFVRVAASPFLRRNGVEDAMFWMRVLLPAHLASDPDVVALAKSLAQP